jgi:hypothetical protein
VARHVLSSEQRHTVIHGASPSALLDLVNREGMELLGGPVRHEGRWAVVVVRTVTVRPSRRRWWLALLLIPAVGASAALLGWFMSGPGPMLVLACLATFGLAKLMRMVRS